MNKEITIGMEKLMAMFIIAMGEWDGICFVYYPNLPKPFCENVKGVGSGCADLLSLRVDPTDDELSVQFWFMDDEHGEGRCKGEWFVEWETIKSTNPMLAVSTFTHIFDMINDLEDC